MPFFNTLVAAFLLSLSIALSPAAAHSSIAAAPTPAPGPVSFNNLIIPIEEQAKDSQYLKAHMTAAANKVELFLANEVEKRLNDPAIGDSEKECLLVCKEVYESAAEEMKGGMESVSTGDFVKANVDVSAFITNIDTCNECFGDFQKFYDWAKGVGGDCLDKIVKYH